MPAAVSMLSWGHTEPHWYDRGLYSGCFDDNVRNPHQLNMSSAISRAVVRRAWSGLGRPHHNSCPGLELIVRTGSLSPSRATA